MAGNGWGEEAAGDERAWLRGRLRTANGWGDCADGCGQRGCQGVAGNGWGEEADGDRRIARTAADGVGAREWLEMGWEKKPLEISELGQEMGAENCADGWCGELRGRLRTA